MAADRNQRIDAEVSRLRALHPDLKHDTVLKLAAYVVDAIDADREAQRERNGE